MKILYTIGALVAIIIIAAGAMSLSGDKTITDILIPQQEETTQDEYVDNTGDVVGGLPGTEQTSKRQNTQNSTQPETFVQTETKTANGFSFVLPQGWGLQKGEIDSESIISYGKKDESDNATLKCPNPFNEFYEQKTIETSSRSFQHGEQEYVISYRINDYVSYPNTEVYPSVFFISVHPAEQTAANYHDELMRERTCGLLATSKRLSESQLAGLKEIFNSWK